MSALIVAVSCVGLTNVVLTALPAQVMLVALVKPVPNAVSVNAGPPATAVLG